MRILAIQLKRIGDLVLTIPALQALKNAAPATHLSLLLTGSTAQLLPALQGVVDQPLLYGSNRGNSAVWRAVGREPFDVCVDFTGSDRSALLSLLSGAKRRVVARSALRKTLWRRFCFNAFVDIPVSSRHTVDYYVEHAAVALGQPVAGPSTPILHLPAAAVARAEAALTGAGIAADAPFIVIHPGSARPEKYWQAERWAEVIDFCQGTLGRPCVLTGGGNDPAERRHLAAIQAALRGAPCVDLAGKLDLMTLAAVLARAALFVGVDSGPMHLAAAWQRPQVVLFGPTNPFHWRPRHARCQVLQGGHGDTPLHAFQARSAGGSVDAISTQAVIDCICTGCAAIETEPAQF